MAKAKLGLKSLRQRQADVKRADQFDIIFIFREALLTGSSNFERAFSRSKAKVIFDFDDAIWLQNVSLDNKALRRLKNPLKTDKIIGYADMVFAGNSYLANYAENFNPCVKIIPTTIDTNYHKPLAKATDKKICIGWTGTQTTLKYVEFLFPVFKGLQQKFEEQIYFKIICDHEPATEGFELKYEKWDRHTEIEQLGEIDIGVMPLVDDNWSRGKCGFKALQYMAMEIPAVVSPIGVNQQIIQYRENGLFAASPNEWYTALSELIVNKSLRLEMGKAGRQTVIDRYSVEAHKTNYLTYFNEVLSL